MELVEGCRVHNLGGNNIVHVLSFTKFSLQLLLLHVNCLSASSTHSVWINKVKLVQLKLVSEYPSEIFGEMEGCSCRRCTLHRQMQNNASFLDGDRERGAQLRCQSRELS